MQEDGLASEGRAVPARYGKIARREAGLAETPFIFRPSLDQVSLRKQNESSLGVRRYVVRRNVQHLFKATQGFVRSALGLPGAAKIVQRGYVALVQRNRGLKMLHGFVESF